MSKIKPLSRDLRKLALKEFKKFKSQAKNTDLFVIVDFSVHSYYRRLYVLDMTKKGYPVIRHHHVAHGVNSSKRGQPGNADKFSNVVMSKKSSLGMLKTGKTYFGSYGRSLKLHGLEKGKNHNVFKRFIVMHKSNYVTDRFIDKHGYAGRSWGCLSVDPAIKDSLVSLIKDGVLIYCYGEE